jgi:flagellar assembly protein FliH
MSEEALSTARLSAWQRWEMGSLGVAPRAEDVARELEAARARGQAEGHAQGFAQGRAEGLASAREDASRLAALVARLEDSVSDHDQRMADEVLDLALVFARQMVGEALSVRREFVLPVVIAALKHLPQSTQRIELRLNPADVELVRSFLASDANGARTQIVGDAAQAPGGCRIETEHTAVDASVETRWRRLLANLGRNDEWLEPA